MNKETRTFIEKILKEKNCDFVKNCNGCPVTKPEFSIKCSDLKSFKKTIISEIIIWIRSEK